MGTPSLFSLVCEILRGEDVKACLGSEPGGASTSMKCLEILGVGFVCHR